MAWLPLIALILQLILKAPEYIEMIKKWIELIRSRRGGLNAAAERAKMGKAIKAVLAGEASALCPVKSCVDDLEARCQ